MERAGARDVLAFLFTVFVCVNLNNGVARSLSLAEGADDPLPLILILFRNTPSVGGEDPRAVRTVQGFLIVGKLVVPIDIVLDLFERIAP